MSWLKTAKAKPTEVFDPRRPASRIGRITSRTIPAELNVKKAMTSQRFLSHRWTRRYRVAWIPGSTRKTASAVRRARSFAPSPRVRMKNDSIAPGMRPTTKSTAISGRNTPRPNARMRNVTRRPTPPATTPAANRYQGNRRMNARRLFHPSATCGLRRGVRLNLCPHAALTTNPLFSPRRVGGTGTHGHAAQHASPRGTSDHPHGLVDDAPDRGRHDRPPRARPRNSGFDSARLRRGGRWSVRLVHRGRPHHARPLGNFREQPQPKTCGRLDRAGGPRPQGNDSTRKHALHAEVTILVAFADGLARRPISTRSGAPDREVSRRICLATAGNIPSRVMSATWEPE